MLNEILSSSGWAHGQVTLAKMAKNLFHSWCHSQNPWNPKPKDFFIADSKLAACFEGLNISLAQSMEELWNCKVIAF